MTSSQQWLVLLILLQLLLLPPPLLLQLLMVLLGVVLLLPPLQARVGRGWSQTGEDDDEDGDGQAGVWADGPLVATDSGLGGSWPTREG